MEAASFRKKRFNRLDVRVTAAQSQHEGGPRSPEPALAHLDARFAELWFVWEWVRPPSGLW